MRDFTQMVEEESAAWRPEMDAEDEVFDDDAMVEAFLTAPELAGSVSAVLESVRAIVGTDLQARVWRGVLTEFGRDLARRRNLIGMTTQVLADTTGLVQDMVEAIEVGLRSPAEVGVRGLAAWMRALSVSSLENRTLLLAALRGKPSEEVRGLALARTNRGGRTGWRSLSVQEANEYVGNLEDLLGSGV